MNPSQEKVVEEILEQTRKREEREFLWREYSRQSIFLEGMLPSPGGFQLWLFFETMRERR